MLDWITDRPTLTYLVLMAIVVAWAVEALLSARQRRHVVAHRDTVPDAFRDTVQPEEHRRAADYTLAQGHLARIEAAVEALLTIVWLLGGIALAWQIAGLGAKALAAGGIVRELLLVALMALVGGLASLPFAWLSTFRVEARFGFNRMTQALFWTDLVKSILLSVALLGPLLALVFWLMRQAGSNWWLWAWGAFVGFQWLMLALYPTLIAPLFNRFTPLDRAHTRTAVESLLARTGFAARGIYVADGSRRSSHGNAYFTGFGRARRIVFFDTLLDRLTDSEVVAVLAHELGHFKRRHILQRLVLATLASGLFLFAVDQAMRSPLLYAAVGIDPQDGLASPGLALAIVATLLPPLFFWLAPLASWYSRKHEFEADRFAATTASAHDLISALVKLYRDNASTLTPDPLYSAWHHSHPPAGVRIAHLKALTR